MIIVLNGYPGVGKLTIGRALARSLKGRLLDIHTTHNLAFALTEFRSADFWNTVEQVEAIAHKLILKLPADQVVVLTTVLTSKSEREQSEWGKIVELGRKLPPFCVVHIGCDLEENVRRIQSVGRDEKRKPRNPEMAERNQAAAEPLAGLNEKYLLELDTTHMAADEAARTIARWCSEI